MGSSRTVIVTSAGSDYDHFRSASYCQMGRMPVLPQHFFSPSVAFNSRDNRHSEQYQASQKSLSASLRLASVNRTNTLQFGN